MLIHSLPQLQQFLRRPQLETRVALRFVLKVRGLAVGDVDLLARVADVEPLHGSTRGGRVGAWDEAEGLAVEFGCKGEGAGRNGQVYVGETCDWHFDGWVVTGRSGRRDGREMWSSRSLND